MTTRHDLFSTATLEQMFAGTHPEHKSHIYSCSKNGLRVDVAIPDSDGSTRTLETLQPYLGRTAANGNIFHVLVSSSATPAYPILSTAFVEKYETEQGSDTMQILMDPEVHSFVAFPRPITVQALVAPTPGQLATSWGTNLPFSPGSYLLRYGPGDFAVIDPVVFAKTYRVHPETLHHFVISPKLGTVFKASYNGTGSVSEINEELAGQMLASPGGEIAIAGLFRLRDMIVPRCFSAGDVIEKLSWLYVVSPGDETLGEAFHRENVPVGNPFKRERAAQRPFKRRRLNVEWAPAAQLDSPEDCDEFPNVVCATQYELGCRACGTPDYLVNIDVKNECRLYCVGCKQRARRCRYVV